MTDIIELKRKIDELEDRAQGIEESIRVLIDTAEIYHVPHEQDPVTREYLAGEIAFYEGYFLISPDADLDRLQREIVQQYDQWCIEADFIILNYYPDQIREFRNLKYGGTSVSDYGIIGILTFEREYRHEPDKRKIINEVFLKFDQQRSILKGISSIAHLIPPKETKDSPNAP